MEIFNSIYSVYIETEEWDSHVPHPLFLSDNFRLFPSPSRYPHYTRGGTSKGSLRYDEGKGAATAKDAEVCSLCHFGGQNRSGRKKRFGEKERYGTRNFLNKI